MIAYVIASRLLPFVDLASLLVIVTAVGDLAIGAYLYRRLSILSGRAPGKKGWY